MKLDLQNRTPKVEILPDLRLRVTRVYDVLNYVPRTTAGLSADVELAWGTADVTYPQCLLIKQDITGQENNPAETPNREPPKLTRVYEQIDPTLETSVGNADVEITLDGLTTVSQTSLQFSSGTAVYQTPGTTTAPAPWASAILIDEQRTDDGTLRRIKRVYLIGGQISINKEFRLSPDTGTTGVTVYTIKYRTGSTSATNPITPPASTTLITQNYDDSPSGRMWTATYAHGQGVISSSVDIRENGNLYIYAITSINAIPTTPTASIGGTVALIKSDTRNGTRFEDGTVIYSYEWAEGNGTIATKQFTRTDGLLEVTIVSIGTRVAPSGTIVRDDTQQETGYTLYTVSAMQAANGSGVISASLTFGSIERFTYPGRLKAFVSVSGTKQALDVYKSPPVSTEIQATTAITYQNTGTLTLGHTLWSPTDAAGLYAQWVGINGIQHNLTESYPGYRCINTSGSLSSVNNTAYSIFNQTIQSGFTAVVNLAGGPTAPDGNTYTLHVRLEPAFTDTSGTTWFRKVEVYATIPAQPALPV